MLYLAQNYIAGYKACLCLEPAVPGRYLSNQQLVPCPASTLLPHALWLLFHKQSDPLLSMFMQACLLYCVIQVQYSVCYECDSCFQEPQLAKQQTLPFSK